MRLGRAAAAALVLIGVVSGLAVAGGLGTSVEGVRVELAAEPERPGTARPTVYRLRLSSADGTPVTGAKVTLQGRMADGMIVVAPLRPGPEPGIYGGRVLFTMEGQWEWPSRRT